MRHSKTGFLLLAGILTPVVCWASANYAEDLRVQAAQIKKNTALRADQYFRDMGIVARKADDAEQNDVASEIVRGLFEDSDAVVEAEIDAVNALFEQDAFQAARKIPDFSRYSKYFQPSENFLKTALGRALNGDVIQFRTNAIEAVTQSCTKESILQGVQAIKKTGLYVTNSPQEIEAMRTLTNSVSACLSWKPEIVFIRSQPFETLYEAGTITEEARLRLESSRSDLAEARWVGEWIYRYTGREGKGEGVSQAVLTYRRGADLASLVISTSRVSSSGRMNFPNSFSGEKRTMDVSGPPLNPQFNFFGKKLSVTGSEAEK